MARLQQPPRNGLGLMRLSGMRANRVTGRFGSTGAAPVNIIAPALDDTTITVGDTVTCGDGTWTGAPTSYNYSWKRDGTPIGGTDQPTYVAVSADAGAALSCAVTASNAVGTSDPVDSDSTEAVTWIPINTVAPVSTSNGAGGAGGPAIPNDILTTDNGTWTGSPAPSFSYQWRNTSGDIPSAIASSYSITGADIFASPVLCRVTGTNAIGNASADSNAIDVIEE